MNNPIAIFLNESLLFSRRIIIFDKHKLKESNCILITGISASGKSTLGKKIAKRLGGVYISTDDFYNKFYKKFDSELEEYARKEDWEAIDKLYIKLAQDLMKLIDRTRKTKLTIVEGIHILDYWRDKKYRVYDIKWVSQFPCIILQTSVIKASIRGFNRERKKFIKQPGEWFTHFYRRGIHWDRFLKLFVKEREKYATEASSFEMENLEY